MLIQNYFKITQENNNKNEDKFKFQGHSVRSQSLFDFYFYWDEESFSTNEPDFYKNIFKGMMKHKIKYI